MLLSAVGVIGILDFAGVSQLRSFLAGLDPDPEPEAQGSPLGVDGQMVTARVFRFTRHPSNLGALGVFLLFPRITVNWVTLVVQVALYVVLGSLHEERRLRAAYGEPFGRHRREVPFLVPRLRRGKNLLAFHRRRCRYRANICRLAPRTHLRYRVDLSRPADRGSPGTAVADLMAVAS